MNQPTDPASNDKPPNFQATTTATSSMHGSSNSHPLAPPAASDMPQACNHHTTMPPSAERQSSSFDEADALAAAALAAEARTSSGLPPNPMDDDDDGLSHDARMADTLAAVALRADAERNNNSMSANSALPWPLSETDLANDPPGKLSTSHPEGSLPQPTVAAPAPWAIPPHSGEPPDQHQQYDINDTYDDVVKRTSNNQISDDTDRSAPLLLQAAPTTVKSAPLPTLCNLFSEWISHSAWPGMGLFGESYLLFSVGTLRPIWEVLFEDCFAGKTCDYRVLHSITYSVVIGVIVGMVFVGYKANTMGRRNGSLFTAAVMWSGSLGLCCTSFTLNHHANLMYKSMSVFLFIFGIGVGGEYPMAAASASEQAMVELRKNRALEELEQMHREERSQREGGAAEAYRDESSLSSAAPNRKADPNNRGKRVQLVFMMQGLGIFFNSLTIMVLLLITGQTDQGRENGANYDKASLLAIWRATYGIGFIVLSFVLVSRLIYLNESRVWADDKKRRELLARSMYGGNVNMQLGATSTGLGTGTGFGTGGAVRSPTNHHYPAPFNFANPHAIDMPAIPLASSVSSLSNPSVVLQNYQDEAVLRQVPSTDAMEDLHSSPMWLLLRNYGVRLFGASTCWLLWDVAFYGNKLFQSSFLLALTGDNTTLFQFTLAAAVNSFVAMLGYIGAAMVVDHPQVGRLRLQQFGFLLTGCMFVACGFLFHQLDSTGLLFLYLASSLFGQLGPNCTTFLIPAEIFPTEMRTMCHGICAASGKIGALSAAVLFNWVSDVDMFLVSGYASFAALMITFWTLPETLGLDLYELDRKWRMILDGRKGDYVGAANDPKYLSFYERSKIGLQY